MSPDPQDSPPQPLWVRLKARVLGKTATPETDQLTRPEMELAYQLFLGRRPHPNELSTMMEHGMDVPQLREMFLSSPEFAKTLEDVTTYPTLAALDPVAQANVPRCVHLHIPKTAGTTLSMLLATAAGQEKSISISENAKGPLGGQDPVKLGKYRFIFGHLSFEAMRYFPPDTLAVCILRHPGDRLLSFYRYVGRTDHHPLYKPVNDAKMSFGEFLEFLDARPGLRRDVDNLQMRIVSGLNSKEYLGRELEVFESALSNLLNNRVLCGLTERFDAFQLYLRHLGLLNDVSASRLNSSDTPGDLETSLAGMTAAQRDIFDRYVVWDNLLYDICDRITRDREGVLSAAQVDNLES